MPASRWRKRPVTVDAVLNDGKWATILAWLDSTGYTVPFLGTPAITRNPDGSLNIATLEGVMRAGAGDWVVRGVAGEFYPVRADIFDATYEPEPPLSWTPVPWTDEEAEKFQQEWDKLMTSGGPHKFRVLPRGPVPGPVTHIAGQQVQVGSRLRQRCSWCGEILCDYDLERTKVLVGQDPEPPMWETGQLVRVDGNVSTLAGNEDSAELPEDACPRRTPPGS